LELSNSACFLYSCTIKIRVKS